MALQDKPSRNRPENASWYLALIVILAGALVVWAVISLRIDVFTEALKEEDTVSVLLVLDDGERPELTELLVFHPGTSNAALVAIPEETGTLLSALDRVDRLAVLYDIENRRPYAEAVGELVGREVNFTLRMHLDDFERMVDLIGGIDVFIPNAVGEVIDGRRFLFPPGGVKLDGAKARSYVEYRPPGEHVDGRTDRDHRIIQSLIRGIGENIDFLLLDSVFPYVSDAVGTDFDARSLESFLRALSAINTERLVLQGILGTRRNLDGKQILFPYYDGKLVRETYQRILETLSRDNDFAGDLLKVQVEIRNGTSINGLASRTAHVFQNYGFRVVSVTNADRSDYERTVVLDRRGNPDAARRVAELIRCDQIHSRIEEERDQTVDVTVILGKDFDGRYVKN